MIRSKEAHEELMRKSRERNTKKKAKNKDNRSKKELLYEIERLSMIIKQKDIKINELKDKLKYYKSNTYENMNKPQIDNNTNINHSIIINYNI